MHSCHGLHRQSSGILHHQEQIQSPKVWWHSMIYVEAFIDDGRYKINWNKMKVLKVVERRWDVLNYNRYWPVCVDIQISLKGFIKYNDIRWNVDICWKTYICWNSKNMLRLVNIHGSGVKWFEILWYLAIRCCSWYMSELVEICVYIYIYVNKQKYLLMEDGGYLIPLKAEPSPL